MAFQIDGVRLANGQRSTEEETGVNVIGDASSHVVVIVVDWAPDSREVSSSVITLWPFIYSTQHSVWQHLGDIFYVLQLKKKKYIINGERKRTKLYLALLTVLHFGEGNIRTSIC